jgi:hypothetical protein
VAKISSAKSGKNLEGSEEFALNRDNVRPLRQIESHNAFATDAQYVLRCQHTSLDGVILPLSRTICAKPSRAVNGALRL